MQRTFHILLAFGLALSAQQQRWEGTPPRVAHCLRHSTRHISRERQLDYLTAYVRGGTQKAAGEELHLSQQTIKNGLSDLYCELEVHNVIGALIALGWLWVPGVENQP